jgi:hypothetical protein
MSSSLLSPPFKNRLKFCQNFILMADTEFPDTVIKPDTNFKPGLFTLFVPIYVCRMNIIAAEINFYYQRASYNSLGKCGSSCTKNVMFLPLYCNHIQLLFKIHDNKKMFMHIHSMSLMFWSYQIINKCIPMPYND